MIIGITGKARSGKDTFSEMLANVLFENTGQRFVLMAYAHELKTRVQKDFDLSYEQLWGDEKEEPDKRYKFVINGETIGKESYWTAREILQAYGQFYRTIDPNFWVRALFNTVDDKEYQNVIVTDVRHPNEADPIKDRDGLVIKITRETKDTIHGATHISETAMDDYGKVDFTIVNNWDVDALLKATKELVDIWLSKKGETNNGK